MQLLPLIIAHGTEGATPMQHISANINKNLINLTNLTNNRQLNKSNIDNKLTQSRLSIISNELATVLEKVNDPLLGEQFVVKALKSLGFSQTIGIAQFAVDTTKAQGGNRGKLFVSVCHKAMNKREEPHQ